MHINLLEECRRRENTHPDLHPRTPVPSLHHSCISTGIIVQNRPYDNQKRNKQNANPDHCNQHATANEKQTNQPPIPPLKANNSLSHDRIPCETPDTPETSHAQNSLPYKIAWAPKASVKHGPCGRT